MANNKVKVDVIVDDKGSLKQTSKRAKGAADNLDKAGSSASNFDRKMKGASGASSNASKNFSKMAQGSGGIAGIYAQIAANVFAVSAAFQFLKTSADMSKLIKGQEALGSVTGVAYKSMTKSIQEATGSQIAYQEAAQAAAIGTAAGLSASQLDSLAVAARNTSAALGRDLTDSFNRLIRGVTKAEPELLDELGIVLRLAPATQKYAQAIGKTANELNAFERTQAVANEVLEQTEEKFGKIAAIMDPSGESLNRFLVSFDNVLISIRTGLISGLGPVFDFLSKNTGALMVAMAAVSALIVKSLIPDFGKYADAAKASGFKIKKSLVLQRQEVERLKLEYERMNNSASMAATKSINSFKKIAASKKLGEGSAGGRKALDFLTGASDTKAARVNAERSINAAISAMEKGNKVKSDLLKDFSREELDIAKDTLEKRKRLNLVQEKATQQTYGRMDLALQKFKAKAMLTFNGLGASMISWAGATAAAVNRALAFAGWIGAIVALGSLLYSVGKAAYDYFFPVSEIVEKATQKSEAYLDTMKSVNDELSKMVEVRKEVELTTRSLVEQTGQAAASADAVSKALKLLELQELKQQGLIDAEQFSKARKEFRALLGTLSKLAPELGTVVELFDETGKIDVKGLQLFQNTAISFSTASKELGRNLASVRTELANISGSVQKSPFESLLSSTDTALKTSKTLDKGLRKELQRQILDAENTQKQITADSGGAMVPDEIIQFNQLSGDIATARNEMKELGKETSFLLNLSTELKAVQADYNLLTQQNALAVKQSVSEKRVEFTLEDKKANLIAASHTQENALRSAKQKLLIKEAELKATIADGDPKAIRNAAIQTGLAMEEVNTESIKLKLSEAQLNLQTDLLDIQIKHGATNLANQAKLNGLRKDEVKFASQLIDLQNQQTARDEKRLRQNLDATLRTKKNQSPLGIGVLGREQYKKEQEVVIERKIAENRLAQAETSKNLKEQELALEQSMFDLRMQQLRLEFDLLNKKQNVPTVGETGLTAEQNTLFEKVEQGQSSAMKAQEDGVADTFKAAGEDYDATISKLKDTEKSLSDIGKIQDVISNNFESEMTNAFSSLINGTKSFKDAFKDMAVNILSAIGEMISKLLVMKLIEGSLSSLGLGSTPKVPTPTPKVVPTGLAPGGRYGGVFASGSKLPGYAVGGIASGPQGGYPVELHGTEAVVPLPNGRSIPVEMSGKNSNNSVVVNVSVDNQGNAQTSTEAQSSEQAGKLGKMVAQAVQQELQNQKRSGGILNPYGVA